MIKRPLNERFSVAVARGTKFTTIRDKPWPVGVPIMLYNWTGKPYRSPQCNVASIIVTGFWNIFICQMESGAMRYSYGMDSNIPLWQHEGFESPEELDEWFRPMVDPGMTITKTLMRFNLHNALAESISRVDLLPLAVPLPCPFCGDPMRINGAKLITHAIRPAPTQTPTQLKSAAAPRLTPNPTIKCLIPHNRK